MQNTASETGSFGRSIMATAVGYLFLVGSLGLTYLIGIALLPGALPKLGSDIAPSAPVLSVVAALCLLYGFVGCWLAVFLARRARVAHGLALGGVTLVLGLLKPILAPHQEPLWSHMVLLTACVVGVIAGAYLPPSRDRVVT